MQNLKLRPVAAALLGLAVAAMQPSIPSARADGMAAGPAAVVFADDGDADALPRRSDLVERVLTEVEGALSEAGVLVFDETATTADYAPDDPARRGDAEILALARTIVPPINVAVIVRTYVDAERGRYGDMVFPRVRVAARLLNVRSGKFVGAVDLDDTATRPLPKSCDSRTCLVDRVGDQAAILAYSAGDEIAAKLSALVAGSEGEPRCAGFEDSFVIRLRQFDEGDINRIESLLAGLGCYRRHTPIVSKPGLMEFAYDTAAGDARLARNLRRITEEIGVEARVSQTGNLFDVVRLR